MLPSLAYKLYRRKACYFAKQFSTTQFQDLPLLLGECDTLTRDLAVHAGATVPYYEEMFHSKNIEADSFDVNVDWGKIPILEKSHLKEQYHQLISTKNSESSAHKNHTGGSTGQPVTFLTDWQLYDRMAGWMDLVFSWCGWKVGELRLHFWGSNKENRLPSIYQIIRSKLVSQHIIPVYGYTEKDIAIWVNTIKILKPTVLYGYPSVLTDLAKWLDSYPSQRKELPNVKGIYSTAEILYPNQRQVIETVFSCKVYNQYGSRETPGIACECPEGQMHFFPNTNRLEFIDSEEFDSKEIIVTPLFSYSQPLLRYRLGDCGRPKEGSCICGRTLPLMELDIARSRDFLIGAHSKKFYPGFFTRLMDSKDWIRSFQFVQSSEHTIEIFIVPESHDEGEQTISQLQAELSEIIKKEMGRHIECFVRKVDTIKRNKAGKHRFVINEWS